ncbi:MAG: hypothetical protein IPI38_17595 [Gemmatimonadetes bacterium]|nr:hypothetical protein [Gemmatimonadota bacterium]
MPTTEELARATRLTVEAGAQSRRPQHRSGGGWIIPTRDGANLSGSSGSPRWTGRHRRPGHRQQPDASDIEAALATLPPRREGPASLLRARGRQQPHLEEIGRMMGVTRERIRQLRDRALTRLRGRRQGQKLKI